MASEFLLTFGAEGILKKVASILNEQISLAWGFKDDLKKLANMLSPLQKLLNYASDKETSEVLDEWVKKLKAIALDADDVLDECNYEVLRRKVELQNHMKRKMLDSLKPEKAGLKNRDALLKSLREELTGKKYLLILDDVWNEIREKWESLMSCLSKLNTASGSSIIITTRSVKVASMTKTHAPCELEKLSNDECWSILKQTTLEKDDLIDSDRETIGRGDCSKVWRNPIGGKGT
ncbi:hypothetical protein M0R45_020232 [Rubus argutus]|uniref:Disease resistance N-terminal domain-containing protein n=1 Tax=Rubus argutus TaxID=59490 RepID=A0AAW1X9F3_RUBAR